MSQSRRQAKQLERGDRFLVPLTLAFEVNQAESNGETVCVSVVPVPCGPSCPNECDCDSSLLDGHSGPFRLTLDQKRKLPYLGNLSQLLASLEQTQAQIERLQSNESGDEAQSQTRSTHSTTEDLPL